MYSVSQGFKDALTRSHRVITKAEVLRQGQAIQTLWINSGQVDIDATAAIRRKCKVTLADELGTLTPASAADLLTPFGNELKLYRGIRFADGSEEYVPQGVFGMTTVDIEDDGPGVVINVEGYDRSKKVQRARFTGPVVIAAGTN